MGILRKYPDRENKRISVITVHFDNIQQLNQQMRFIS
jgi:uncharacterized protein YciI